MSIFGGKKSKKGGSKAATPDSKASSKKSAQSPSDSATEPSALTEGTSKGRSVITCSILLMEAPAEAAKPGSSTPAGRKKFEVLQVSFTQDATINSVLQNVKLQSSHNKGSLASTCIGLCRPGGVEFVNSVSVCVCVAWGGCSDAYFFERKSDLVWCHCCVVFVRLSNYVIPAFVLQQTPTRTQHNTTQITQREHNGRAHTRLPIPIIASSPSRSTTSCRMSSFWASRRA